MSGHLHHAGCGCPVVPAEGRSGQDEGWSGPGDRGSRATGRKPRQGIVSRGLAMLMIVFVRGYQLVISPYLPPRCRHLPTCSAYAIEAVQLHGPVHGAWLALRRILRCHPWGTSGYDPVPPRPGSGAEPGAGKSGEADA